MNVSEIKSKLLSSKLKKEIPSKKSNTILLIFLSFIVTLHILVSFDVFPNHDAKWEEVESVFISRNVLILIFIYLFF